MKRYMPVRAAIGFVVTLALASPDAAVAGALLHGEPPATDFTLSYDGSKMIVRQKRDRRGVLDVIDTRSGESLGLSEHSFASLRRGEDSDTAYGLARKGGIQRLSFAGDGVEATRYRLEVYETRPIEIRAGDRIRWTRNDKARDLVNGEAGGGGGDTASISTGRRTRERGSRAGLKRLEAHDPLDRFVGMKNRLAKARAAAEARNTLPFHDPAYGRVVADAGPPAPRNGTGSRRCCALWRSWSGGEPGWKRRRKAARTFPCPLLADASGLARGERAVRRGGPLGVRRPRPSRTGPLA